MAVDPRGVPARRLEAHQRVAEVRKRERAVDGDVVVIIENDLGELQVTRKADRLVADALHQVAVRGDDIGEMVNDFSAVAGLRHTFGQRHADRCGDALAERAGGCSMPSTCPCSG